MNEKINPPSPAVLDRKAERAKKLAVELRANLKRRKAAGKSGQAGDPEDKIAVDDDAQ